MKGGCRGGVFGSISKRSEIQMRKIKQIPHSYHLTKLP